MEALVLNKNFEVVAIIDAFESFIWTERYSSFGEFELYLPIDDKILEVMPNGSMVANPDSGSVMFVEKTTVESSVETGTHVTKSGRSLESILERRIVLGQTDLVGNFQTQIKTLITENVINPSDTKRKISNFVFVDSTDSRITSLEIETQLEKGKNLYEAVKEMCDERGVGFKVVLSDDLKFEFSLYLGIDRSYSQSENPYVVFSPEYDNLINSNYEESTDTTKNVALVAGPGEEDDRISAIIGDQSLTGLDRREGFIDASELSYDDEDGETMTDEVYARRLVQYGYEELSKTYGIVKAFEGEAEVHTVFTYGTDFFLGDIVQLENEYGMGGASRLTEMVFTHDGSGITAVPTFEEVPETSYSDPTISGSVPIVEPGDHTAAISNATIDEIVV